MVYEYPAAWSAGRMEVALIVSVRAWFGTPADGPTRLTDGAGATDRRAKMPPSPLVVNPFQTAAKSPAGSIATAANCGEFAWVLTWNSLPTAAPAVLYRRASMVSPLA